jgi:hypothetical protein
MKEATMTTKHALPKGITAADLKRPDYKEFEREKVHTVPYDDRQFDLWYVTAFGWCIPTLQISSGGPRRRSAGVTQPRTYAVIVETGKVCRVGAGPHVLETATVYVRPKTLKALQPYLDLRTKGAADAGQVRDRISSRRAQGQLERAAGNTYWRWSV